MGDTFEILDLSSVTFLSYGTLLGVILLTTVVTLSSLHSQSTVLLWIDQEEAM